MTHHPFRFAVELGASLPGRSFADSARELEGLGYSTAFVPDHFDEGLGPITGMTVAAVATTTLTVGSLVLDCDFRHPAVLARELASIDLVSEGRLEVGIGAGWKRLDYDRSGIPMDAPGTRVSRMIEHAKVLKGLFAEGSFSFVGEHYVITDLDGTPAPYRPGGPPFLIAGGARRVLRFAGEVADIVGVNASIHSGEVDAAAAQDSLADKFDEKVGWVREGAGDRFDALEINAWIAFASVTDDGDAVAESLAPLYQTDAASVRSSPLTIIGSVEEIAEELQRRRERWGYSYFVLPLPEAVAFAPVVAALAGS
jgi:probable F420-dependent oxidoreductase, MSMEG_2516 family